MAHSYHGGVIFDSVGKLIGIAFDKVGHIKAFQVSFIRSALRIAQLLSFGVFDDFPRFTLDLHNLPHFRWVLIICHVLG